MLGNLLIFNSVVVLLVVFNCNALGTQSKKYYPDNSREPYNYQNRYQESNLLTNNITRLDQLKPPTPNEEPRLRFGGIPLVSTGNTGSGGVSAPPYGNSIAYSISPMKLDLGGVALGALIGLGAVLFIPKLFYILGGGPGGGYGSYRSTDDESSSSMMTQMLNRIDSTLEQNQIDSSSCVQRIVCTFVHDSQKNVENFEASTMDELILALTRNPLLNYMLDGTAVKQAIEMGRQHDIDKCNALAGKCPLSKEKVANIISTLFVLS